METRDSEHQPHIPPGPTSWLGALPQCRAAAPAALGVTDQARPQSPDHRRLLSILGEIPPSGEVQ